jgi:hypothetical protein
MSAGGTGENDCVPDPTQKPVFRGIADSESARTQFYLCSHLCESVALTLSERFSSNCEAVRITRPA